MKAYCRKCGSPAEHKGIKPNFCPNCGEKMSSFGTPSKSIANSNKKTSEVSDDEEEEYSPINISKLDIEIFTRKSRLTLGDVVGTPGIGLDRGVSQVQGNKEDFMEEFRKEAGGDPHKPK